MAIFKCKMCGGNLETTEGSSVGICEYCGTKQTVPTANDENLQGLYNRANTLRIKSEFDKAEQLYEKILQADGNQAEAYWGLILCKYGIEYVEDPATFKRIPTCHRASYDSIIADDDYKSALKYADDSQRNIYEQEAKEIDRIQKEIIELSSKEEPYDVFICYKETDDTGSRTQDSVIANDIYYQLTQEGFKVFYAAITLEDKLGSAYEPCIFAALNSAKVMLAIGTKPEYFNAVWVKNEWSRYLKIMKKDRSKLLIPCYKNMDAYDLPDEFAHLQAQDMGKIGFINDVVRGIKKVVSRENSKSTPIVNVVNNTTTEPLLKRAFIFLEDGDWNSANEYCEKVLDIDPECAQAYLGKLMAELHIKKQEYLQNLDKSFESNQNYVKIIRYADDKLRNELVEYIDNINAKAEEIRKDSILSEAKSKMVGENIADYEGAIQLLESIAGWKDSYENIAVCQRKIADIKAKAEVAQLEKQRLDAEKKIKDEKAKQQKQKITKIIIAAVAVTLSLTLFFTFFNFKMFTNVDNISTSINHTVALRKDGTVIVAESRDHNSKCNTKNWKNIVAISTGESHIIGLKKDGTVVATGKNNNGQCNVEKWTDIVAVSAGVSHTVGLKKDGTVIATGKNNNGRCNTESWTDMLNVYAVSDNTIGIKKNGTIEVAGVDGKIKEAVADWNNIKSICMASDDTVVGLKKDGTVVIAIGECMANYVDEIDWTNIDSISISTYGNHVIGLKNDGTVVAAGDSDNGQCNIKGWSDIVAISAGDYYTVGLKKDGTVVYAGDDKRDKKTIESWTDVAAVSTSKWNIVGVKKDNTAVASDSAGFIGRWRNWISFFF